MPSAYKEVMVALKGGLNTALDPSIIGMDQLTEASGMEYRPPRGGLFGAQGRVRFDTNLTATASSTRIHALGYCPLNLGFLDVPLGGKDVQSTHFIVAFSGATAFLACATGTGTFIKNTQDSGHGTLTPSATAFGEFVYHDNAWFYFNGIDFNRALSLGGAGLSPSPIILTPHGLQALTASGSAAATAVVGASLGTGAFELWWTESSGASTFESAYVGAVTTITLSATALGIAFSTPAIYGSASGLNLVTFQRNIYMGSAGQKYPFGFLQREIVLPFAGPYNITAFSTVDPYPIVAPLDGVPVSANLEAPIAYSMVSFQDCLVCIPALNRGMIQWSLPGEHHNWPSTNIATPSANVQDDGNALATINGVLLHFSARYASRIDFLPQASDADAMVAATGRIVEKFLDGHGCQSPRGVATFTAPTGVEFALFVCHDGIHITDGRQVGYATSDMDFSTLVDAASLSRHVLRNNPARSRIEYYYADFTDPTKWKRLDFYYHATLIRPGEGALIKLPALGPTPVPGPCATVGVLDGKYRIWTGSDNAANVWLEGTGTADNALLENADARITKSWKTKNFYLAGMNGEYELQKLYTSQSQTTASGTYTITSEGITDDVGTSFYATSTIDQSLKGGQQHPALHMRGQRFSIRGEKADGGEWQELNYLVFVVKGASELESAKSS